MIVYGLYDYYLCMNTLFSWNKRIKYKSCVNKDSIERTNDKNNTSNNIDNNKKTNNNNSNKCTDEYFTCFFVAHDVNQCKNFKEVIY